MAVLFVFIQYQDLSGYFYSKGSIFREEQVFESSLKSELWDVIAEDYDHMFYMGYNVNRKHIFAFTAHNKLTINENYVARADTINIEALKWHTWEQLNNGLADSNYVYIFEAIPEHLIHDNKLYVYIADDMILGFADEIENVENMNGVIRLQ